MAHQQEDLSQLPPLYERVTTATETPEELQHRLHLEKAKFYASVLVYASVLGVLSIHHFKIGRLLLY